MKKPNILVTGANGFIGHHLCRKLLDDKHSVLALTRSKNPKQLQPLLKKPGLSLLVGDINNSDFVKELFSSNKIDVVFHMAIEAAHRDNNKSKQKPNVSQTQIYQTNVLGTINLFEQASQHFC